jgi:16S rRNA (cytosine967-C5)-methyltransferase
MKQETINSREEALKVITKALKNEYSIDKELEIFHKKSINYEFKGFVNEIVQGTVKRLLEIDEYIRLLITSKLNKLPEMILNILRISVYQLLYMKSVPQSAVINEAVNLAKRYGHKGTANLTNAVLRNLLRKQTELETKINNYPLKKRISIKASIPMWIVDYWSLLINENELEEILLKTLEKPEFYLRINTLKTSSIEFKNKLKEDNITFNETEFDDLIELIGEVNLNSLYGFKEGLFYIQDKAAFTVTKKLDPQENESILDLCCFPGGKTSHISQEMNNTGKIIAIDNTEKRIDRFNENITKLGATNIEVIIKDASEELGFVEKFDRILIDAPCSGLGIIRRKSEIKYKKTIEDIKRLADIQQKILINASKYLKSGGKLIYSTCTLSRYENEDNIKQFLDENKDFILIDTISMNPFKNRSDFFFIAEIQKRP